MKDIKDIRRSNLTIWFASHSIPEKEKSYISQLKNGSVIFSSSKPFSIPVPADKSTL